MLRQLLFLTLAALITGACAHSSKPPRTIADRPPAADLTCPAEPPAPAEDATEADALAFDIAVLMAGRACRDALARVCGWHQLRAERGTIECAARR